MMSSVAISMSVMIMLQPCNYEEDGLFSFDLNGNRYRYIVPYFHFPTMVSNNGSLSLIFINIVPMADKNL